MKTNVAITSMIIGTKPAPTPKKVGSKLAASPQKGTGTIDGFLAFLIVFNLNSAFDNFNIN